MMQMIQMIQIMQMIQMIQINNYPCVVIFYLVTLEWFHSFNSQWVNDSNKIIIYGWCYFYLVTLK